MEEPPRSFTRSLHFRPYCLLFLATLLFTHPLTSAPYPPDGMVVTWTQPDGTRLKLRVFGDEFYGRTETEEGYTVVYDPATGAYHYAELSADEKRLVPTGERVTADPRPEGKKHLRLPPDEIRTIREAAKEKYAPGEAAAWARKVKAAQLRRKIKKGKASSPEADAGDDAVVGGSNSSAPESAPVNGSYVGLTILVQFPDDPDTPASDPLNFPATQAKMERYCNEIGYSDDGNTGSIRDYFSDQSLGTVTYTQVVTNPVTLPNARNYYNYDDYPTNSSLRDSGETGRLVIQHAIAELQNQGFDFSPLSLNSSDRVIATNVLFAGSTSGVWSEGLWPHRWVMSPQINVGTAGDPIYIYDYQITNAQTSAVPVGTFIHENGHLLLKLPDLYDTNGGSEGIGEHGLMGSGNHLNGGRTPAPVNAYFKDVVGWATVNDLSPTQFLEPTLPTTGNQSYRLQKPGTSTEYFIVENRGANDPWAGSTRDTGIIIWHIDETVNGNQNEQMTPTQHYEVSVEQADGDFDLENDANRGDSGDYYDSTTQEFTDSTLPDAKWWDGSNSGISIDVLDPVGPNMKVRFGDQPPNTITVIDPNGGESLARGATTPIVWSANITGNVRIELHKGGSFHSLLASSEANGGSFDWAISQGLALGSDYRIRVSSVNNPSIEDFSDADFTLVDEVFPPGGTIPPGWITSSGADAGWEVATDEVFEGSYSLRNVDIDDSETASIEVTGDFSAGNVTYQVKVSSESGWDYFRFYVDGVEQGSGLSGEVAWTSRTHAITAGTRTLRWSYIKDESVSSGSDTAWIDQVSLPAPPAEPDITIEEPVNTTLTSGSSTTDFGTVVTGETVQKTYTIRNLGDADLTGLAVTIDGADASQFSWTDPAVTTLAPNASTTFTVSFDPSGGPGSRSANLHVASDDPDTPNFEIGLAGTAALPPSLTSLSLSTGVLHPDFDSGLLAYGATVPSSAGSLTVTATAAEPSQTLEIRINGGGFNPMTSGQPSAPLPLAGGPNLIELRVTAAGGGSSEIYEISFTPGEQLIDVLPLAPQTPGFAGFTVYGTASSGLGVTYDIVAGGHLATIAGANVSSTGGSATGAVTIRASQAGDGDYDPAEDVYVSFRVSDEPVFQQVETSPTTTFAIADDGTLWATGNNYLGASSSGLIIGKLGDGDQLQQPFFFRVGTDTDWAKIAASPSHTLAIRTDGSLWAWGNNFGRLGDGTTTTRSEPVRIGTDNDWVQIDVGYTHSIALKANGTLWAWGSTNTDGQIGDGTTSSNTVPVQIGTDTDWQQIRAGSYHNLAIKNNGTLWGWGRNDTGQLGDGGTTNQLSPIQIGSDTDWSSIACGFDHSLALKTGGELWAWGDNSAGELGDGSDTASLTPKQIGSATDWVEIAAGSSSSLARKNDNTLWSWGVNLYGQVGDGTLTNRRSPVRIAPEIVWTQIAADGANRFARDSSGRLFSWGYNLYDQLGRGVRLPSPLPSNGGTFSLLSVSHFHTLAIRSDGTLWSWGVNFDGQLGEGSIESRRDPVPVRPSDTWQAVSAGYDHSMAIRSDGTLWAWGDNANGFLGDGNTIEDQTTPVQIGPDSDWQKVSAGTAYTAAIRTDGTLWTWGENGNGQLGIGSTTDQTAPFQVGTATDWSQVSAGYRHTLALKTDGTLWAWGYNLGGRLGDGTTTQQTSPVQIGTDNDWVEVAAGFEHSVGRKIDGTIWAWGENRDGRVGNGTWTDQNRPVPIGTDTDWIRILGGETFTIALKSDGSLWVWGASSSGENGNGMVHFGNTPEPVGSEHVWESLPDSMNGRSRSVLAFSRGGGLWGWGEDSAFQLAGATPGSSFPGPALPPVPQFIDFPQFTLPPPGQSVTLNATATSGLPVGYLVDGPATLSGNELTVTGPGAVEVIAYQSGDAVWNSTGPALSGTNAYLSGLTLNGHQFSPSFESAEMTYFAEVSRSVPSVTVTPVAISANATIEVRSNGGSFLPVLSGQASDPLPIQPGSNLIEVRVTAQDGLTTETYLLAIDSGLQSIDFPEISTVPSDSAPFALPATASSGLPIDYTVLAGNDVVSVSEGTVTLSGSSGPVTIVASQDGDADYLPAEDVIQTFYVTPSTPAIVEISLGRDFSVIRKADGTLWSEGYNFYGPLGDGTTVERRNFEPVGTDTDWVEVSAGYNHVLARKSDGTLWAWGRNSSGRLGDGTTVNRHSPVQIGTDTDWTSVAAGDDFSLAIKSNGTLWAWGDNASYQLGQGNTTNSFVPIQVGTDTDWQEVSGGDRHALGLKTDGTLWAWGDNASGQVGNGSTLDAFVPEQIGSDTDWQTISAGALHSLALKANGTLWAWGENSNGQIGTGTTSDVSSPVQVGSDTDWTAIAGAIYHSLARKIDGTLWAWGDALWGQLGTEDTIDQRVPVQLGTDSDWTLIPRNMGLSVLTLAVRGGVLQTWGGNSTLRPWGGVHPAPFLPDDVPVAQVSVGDDHTLAIRSDGTLWGWGDNFSGKLGDGTFADRVAPVPIGIDSDWSAVSAGDHHTLGLKDDGTLWAWGDASQGQLGTGDTTDQWAPFQIGSDDDWAGVETGDDHSVALKTDGTLWAWGDNFAGQVGDGTTTDQFFPVQISPDSDWKQVSSGDRHNLAVKTDGTLWGWGDNNRGQLGDGTIVDKPIPTRIGTDNDWNLVTAGYEHSLGIRTDGTLWAWGNNSSGRLGDGTTIQRESPVQIGSDDDWVAVVAALEHTLALKNDGTLWAWGDNEQARLGNGDYPDQIIPVQVGTTGIWTGLPAGGMSQTDLSLAVSRGGLLWGWGDNGLRLLGENSWDHRRVRARHPVTPQVIAFPDVSMPSSYGESVTLAATSSSGLPVRYVAGGDATLDGNELTVTGPGPIFLYAYQEGDVYVWDSAPPVEASFIEPEITIEHPANTSLTDGTSTIDHGDINPGKNSVKTFLIRNDGDDDLTGLAAAVDGANAADFAIGALSSTSLAPGETATFDVTFSPSALGARSAAVHIANNDLDENPFDIGLTGTGVVPEITVEEPAGTNLTDGTALSDFGSINSGQSAARTYTIRNDGSGVLSDLAVSIAGPDATEFSATQPGSASLQPGESITFTVTFSPNGFGARDASLRIASDDADENPFDIGLAGVALAPEIAVLNGATPLADGISQLDLDAVIAGIGASNTVDLTIRNVGNAPLTGLSASVDGVHGSEFGAGPVVPTTLAPNESTTLTVTFSPAFAGNLSAALHLASNDEDENPFDLFLSGIGIQRTTLRGWAEGFGLSGDALLPSADNDGDFVSLVEEYAYNMDPTTPDAAAMAPGTGTSGLPAIRLVGGRLQVEYVRRRSDPDLTYVVEFGDTPSESDLAPAVESPTSSSIGNQFERHLVNDSETTQTRPTRFGRVRVSVEEP